MHVKKITTDAELQRSLSLRREVFVDEQGVPLALELDDLDASCAHFLALDGSAVVGTARLYCCDGVAKAQRVAVALAARRSGVGRRLMEAVEAAARAAGYDELILGAQESAVAFYERLAYTSFGERFLDAGIPHRMMKKMLKNQPL